MPTYDYACEKCGHRMEVMHPLHGHGPSTCPVCGGQLRKVFAAPAVVFKGSGWARKERGGHKARSASSGSSDGQTAKHDASSKADSSSASKDGD